MMHIRKLNLLLSAGIVLAFQACSTLHQQPVQAPPPPPKEQTVEDALQLKDDGKVGAAASVMLQISTRAKLEDRPKFLFDAAQLYLSQPDTERAQQIEEKMRSDFPANGYTRILSGQISLALGNLTEAQDTLQNAPPSDVDDPSKGLYWVAVAQANEVCPMRKTTTSGAAAKAGTKSSAKSARATKAAVNLDSCLADRLRARAEANDLLIAPADLSANQEAWWQDMSHQTARSLRTVRNGTKNPTLKAWIDLALLTNRSKVPVPERAIRDWVNRNPTQVVLDQRLLELRGQTPETMRHMAVILPTHSPELSAYAKSVWEGFQAAQASGVNQYPIKLYETDSRPESTLKAYQSALDNGAILVIGPLTRSSLTLLAHRRLLAVPTVALNVLDEGKLPINLYQFGLPVAQEARIVAREAKKQGFTQAVILKGTSEFDQRSAEAFAKEWTGFHYEVSAAMPLKDTASIDQLVATGIAPGTMVFIAADFDTAFPVMKTLPDNFVLFGTSALNTASPDIAQLSRKQKIYFVDVPNLAAKNAEIDPDKNGKKDPALTRLYVLGADACRFSSLILRDQVRYNRPLLNGDTGKLSLTRNGSIQRDLPLLSLPQASIAAYHYDDLEKLSISSEK